MKYLMLTLFLLLPIFSTAKAATSAPPSDPTNISDSYSDTLFGDWAGKRSTMKDHGYDLQVIYKLDLLSTSAASKLNNYALDNLDVKLSLDFDKIFGSQNTSGFLHILSNRGDKPALQADRLPHGVDNIETPANANTTKIFQAWLQQSFMDDSVSVLAGLYDLNSEFYATESSALFTHPTFGIGAEFAGTGKNGPSVFPTSSVGVRVKVIPAPGYYLQAVTLDGVPGDPNNPNGTSILFNEGDGALNVIEGGIPLSSADNAHNNKLAFGMWQYTSLFDDVLDVDASGNPVQRVSHGIYAMLEKVLRYKDNTNEEQIKSFFRIGQTEGDTSQFDLAWSTGLVFSGLISGREQDELGIAFAEERNGAKYRIANNNTVAAENSAELAYRYHARPGFVVQPFLQYLLNHGNDPAQNKTWWLGVRMEMIL